MARGGRAVNEGGSLATIFRWLLRILTLMVAVAAAGLGVLWLFLSRSLVDPDADFVMAGIGGAVEIVRDNAAVPHIFADSDADVYFGLGVAHAQDRLWQMMMLRRTAQGRLSELFGERTLRTDELLRRLDLYGAARASVRAQDAETAEMLESYAAGVNAWLAEIALGARGRGAPEFFLFRPTIEPWTQADSVAVIKLMGLQLSSHLENEVLLARLSLLLEPDRVDEIMPADPGEAIATLPEYSSLFPGVAPSSAAFAAGLDEITPFPRRPFAGASNAWAAAPSRAAAGGALLANDPHLSFTAPSIWYLAHLGLGTGDVIGGTIPGLPVILTGRSAELGWGITSSYLDDQDVLIEELNPEDPSQYRTPGGWSPFRTRQSIIEVAGGQPVTLQLQWTRSGPVLPDAHYDLGSVTPPGHVAALQWTVLDREDTSLTAARRLMTSRSVEEALAASEGFVAPSQNLTLADGAGRIAMRTIGAMPNRSPDHQSLGRLPAPGWVEENIWDGYMPADANPVFVDPEGGLVGNTNNKAVDRPFPRHVSFQYGDTQRIHRWRRLMQSRQVHTRESFMEAQLDIVSYTARALLPLIGRDLWFTSESAPEGTLERRRKRALDLLAEWNGEMNEHRPEPLIYAAWLRALQDRLIRDEIGPLSTEFSHPEPLFIEAVFRDAGGAGRWCDVMQSAPVETCQDISRLALDDALFWIAENWGEALESLRWGDAHEATHDHQILGTVPVVRWLVNIRQSTSGGDQTLLRGRTKGTMPDPFLNVHGAGYRGVYDFADPNSSVFVIATGQSGHPLSRHYDDLGDLWRRGEYIPMTLDPQLARAGADGVTTITPAVSASE